VNNLKVPSLSGVLNGLIVATALFAGWRLESPVVDSRVAEPKAQIVEKATLEIRGLDWSTANRNIVLVVDSQCPACNASADFFKVLSESSRRTTGWRLVVLSRQPFWDVTKWLSDHNVRFDVGLQVLDLPDKGINATPAILVVDSQGKVERVSFGVLNQPAQDSLLAEIRDLSRQ
jgi:hypothetical protein